MVVYTHTRLDKNEVFYVGVGSIRRSKAKSGRNSIWKSIVKKTDYKIDIVATVETYKEAFDLEIELIKKYGRIDRNTGCLANMTDGGEGGNGFVASEESKIANSKRVSKWLMENGHPNSKEVICLKTGKQYESSSSCAKENNIPRTRLCCKLSGRCFNDTFFIYKCDLTTDLNDAFIERQNSIRIRSENNKMRMVERGRAIGCAMKGKKKPEWMKKVFSDRIKKRLIEKGHHSSRSVVCLDTGKRWSSISSFKKDVKLPNAYNKLTGRVHNDSQYRLS